MPSISKFYLHDAATPNTGTMPGAGDAFIKTSVTFTSDDVTGDAAGARTARAADATIGTLQTSAVFTATANTTSQSWGWRRFVSAPLAAQTFANGDGNWTFSYARSESNLNHNQAPAMVVYPWRPSTGLQIGTFAGTDFCVIGGNPPSVAATEQAQSVPGPWGAVGTSTTILDGDVLVFEVSDGFTQSMATAYTSTFFYDGTTEASATSCASFVTPPAALTLSGGAAADPNLPYQFDPIPFLPVLGR